jgi:hypothetical protein
MAKQPKHIPIKPLASAAERKASVLAFLEEQVWKSLPKKKLGRVLSSGDEDALLGYGPTGVPRSTHRR